MKIILFPGLGYTHHLFQNLQLGPHQWKCQNWIDPLQGETLSSYARRMFQASAAGTEEPIILIGHSFGGILAQGIARQYPIQKVILLSSIRSRMELPAIFKIIAPLQIHRIFTRQGGLNTIRWWGPRHGFESETEIQLFKTMIGSYSNNYLQWALKTLSNWQPNSSPTSPIFQIHGTNDRTFPFRLLENVDFKVEQGSHIMVYKRGEEISALIRSILEE